jgi:hypothetical protein
VFLKRHEEQQLFETVALDKSVTVDVLIDGCVDENVVTLDE